MCNCTDTNASLQDFYFAGMLLCKRRSVEIVYLEEVVLIECEYISAILLFFCVQGSFLFDCYFLSGTIPTFCSEIAGFAVGGLPDGFLSW
jgi:hypothetical protein